MGSVRSRACRVVVRDTRSLLEHVETVGGLMSAVSKSSEEFCNEEPWEPLGVAGLSLLFLDLLVNGCGLFWKNWDP